MSRVYIYPKPARFASAITGEGCGFRGTLRRLYAIVSIENCQDIPYVMSSLDPEAYVRDTPYDFV